MTRQSVRFGDEGGQTSDDLRPGGRGRAQSTEARLGLMRQGMYGGDLEEEEIDATDPRPCGCGRLQRMKRRRH